MLRILLPVVVIATLASALALYSVNYETRRLEQTVAERKRQIERARVDIAILRAERSYLSRPERIAPLARDMLGLVPPRIGQMQRLDDLARAQAQPPALSRPRAGAR